MEDKRLKQSEEKKQLRGISSFGEHESFCSWHRRRSQEVVIFKFCFKMEYFCQ
jgi:hypothetical protein